MKRAVARLVAKPFTCDPYEVRLVSRRVLTIVASLGAALTGCALAASFDGLSGSENAPLDSRASEDAGAGSSDATQEIPDAPSPDGASGLSDAEGNALIDGGFCEANPTATFCSDFETPTVPGWSFPVNGLGSSALSDAGFFSPTHSVRFFRPIIQQDGGTYSSGSLLRVFPNKPTTKIRTSFKFKVNELSRDFSFFAVNMGTYSYRIRLHKGGPLFREDLPVEGGPVNQTLTSLGIPAQLDVWTQVEMQVDFSTDGGAGSAVNVSFDGVSVLKDHALRAHQYVAPVQIETGILFADYTPAAQEVFIDDLLVDIK